jgi:hypothetical protein
LKRQYSKKIENPISRYILLSIPVLFIVGSLMHFIYEWSGSLTLAGLFAPVNESVWEHLKLSFWPILAWWFAGYFILRKNNKILINKWIVLCAVSEITCILVIVSFYYTYTGALGIESVILDIFSLFLGIAIAQVLALHLYKHSEFPNYCLYSAIVLLVILAAAFIVFTFIPPHIPLFKDSTTGNYGI